MTRMKKMMFLTWGIVIVILLSIVGVLHFQVVYNEITLEAGEPFPAAQAFLKKKNAKGEVITPLTSINTHLLTVYPVELKVHNRIHTSHLKIVDTIPPTATAFPQTVAFGTTIEAGALVENIVDATKVEANFVHLPDYNHIGTQVVTIALKDEAGNMTEVTSSLSLYKTYPELTVEAGHAPLKIQDFLMNTTLQARFKTDLKSVAYNQVATLPVEIVIDEETHLTQLHIVDTKPPIATLHNQTLWLGQTLTPEAFVSDLYDATPVTVTFKVPPDFNVLGDQMVTLELLDQGHNLTTYPVMLTIKEDRLPPIIDGSDNVIVYIGNKVSYKNVVKVSDDQDSNVELKIDSSAVNLKKVGAYPVTYTATDGAGNLTQKVITFNVAEKPKKEEKPITLDEVNVLADEVLKSLLKDNMSQKDKAYAIYKWTKTHIQYVDHSDKSDWIKAAYQGLRTHKGDCFNYYATAQALLTRAGIENQRIVKSNGKHYWNLVNCGEGWYHFDTTPRQAGGEFFMLTDAQITAYSKKHHNTHVWDASLYPATPTQ